MNDHHSFSKLRECFNQSLFSTEISSHSQLHQEDSQSNRQIIKISSKFTDDPQVYLKKIKIKKKEASRKCLEALRETVKAQMNLNRMEKEAALFKHDFMKLYTNKKFKLLQQNTNSSHQVDHQFSLRLSLDKVKRQRALDRISLSCRKEQTERNIESLQEASKQDKSFFRETLRWGNERYRQHIEQSAEKIRKQHTNFMIRKKNLNDLVTTKSKFNYLSKINQEMQVIKDYQQMIDLIAEAPAHHKFSSTFTSSFH